MTKITPDVEPTVLKPVRRHEAKGKTMLHGLGRIIFESIVEQETTARAQRRLAELISKSTLKVGVRTGSRDELHER